MRKSELKFFILGMVFLGTCSTARAQIPFQFSAESRVLSSDSRTVKGLATLYLVNTSGNDIKDATVRPETINKMTFSNQAILIGDVNDGSGRGVTIEWSVPVGANEIALPDQPATWHLEYVTPKGQLVTYELAMEQPR